MNPNAVMQRIAQATTVDEAMDAWQDYMNWRNNHGFSAVASQLEAALQSALSLAVMTQAELNYALGEEE